MPKVAAPSVRAQWLVIFLLGVVAGGCAGAPATSPASVPTPTSAAVTPVAPTPSALATQTATAPATEPAGSPAISLPVCYMSDPCLDLEPGTYVLNDPDSFLQGLAFTIPVAWDNAENDIGELSIEPETPRGKLLLVRDITPINHDGTRAVGVERTTEGWIEWLTSNPDFVTSEPQPTTIGPGVPATTLLLGVSTSAVDAEVAGDCPVDACIGVFTAEGWPTDGIGYAIGRQPDPLYLRMYFADLVIAGRPLLLVAVLDAGGAAALEGFETFAEGVLNSIQLPPGAVPQGT